MNSPQTYDFILIGGGIVGLSTAWQLKQQYPDASILLLEKEQQTAQHQTGHNSGVIHAGVYYKPGSLKAELCREGSRNTMDFCREHELAFDQCGKLLVATREIEQERLQALETRCQQNGIEYSTLDAAELKSEEPDISGLAALLVPASGITDYAAIARKMAELFIAAGGKIHLGEQLLSLEESSSAVRLTTTQQQYECGHFVACPGLQADKVVAMLGEKPEFKILPFRGEYFRLKPEHNQIVKHLIYPVPDPDLPFLGVHLTRMIDGSVTVGPNAVLAWAREGYRWRDIEPTQVMETLMFSGARQFFTKHLKTGLHEFRNSVWKGGYLKEVQKYCPSLTRNDLQPYPAGVRAQAMRFDGSLVDDFLFHQTGRSLIVCNAPSPAATSAIPIGKMINEKIRQMI